LYETPVGFKYLADLFLKNKIIFGGEESACLAIKDHLPEKDGIIAGLLVAEMLASNGKSFSQLLDDLFKRYGNLEGGHRNILLTAEREKKLTNFIKNPPSELAERQVLKAETLDGLKLVFSNDDWLLLRLSGTEPVSRCYGESGNTKELDRLMESGMEMLA
jgi:phosphoglucomutase